MRHSSRRYWTVSIIAAVLVAGVVYWLASRITESSVITTVTPSVVMTPQDAPSPVPTPTPIMTPTSAPAPSDTAKPVVIPGSRPTEVYFPRFKKGVKLAYKVCPVTRDANGNPMLDPDRSDYTKACYFVDPSYAFVLPGTNAADVAVIAGHTWRNGQAAFNLLYDWKRQAFTVKKGDEAWVSTAKSDKCRLVYKATALLTPAKYAAKGSTSLMNDPRVWGTKPTPGVLVTVGCLQPRDTSQHSSENIAIKWQFAGVHC